MFINRFNPSAFMQGPMLPAFSRSSQPIEAPRPKPTSYFPTNQPTYDNSEQFAFPDFQPKSFFRPLASSLSSLGNNFVNGLNSGISGLQQFSPTMPAWGVRNQGSIQQPPQLLSPPPLPPARPTARQIFNSIGQGASQGFQDFSKMAKQHGPLMLGVGAGLAGAGAVCPFMCGTMAATGGAMLAQQQGASNN